MVVFTCGHCGDSLQKPKVAKHYQFQCRKTPYLTCVDCLKDFKDQEYEQHNKCFTEDQRYSAQGINSEMVAKKGEKKQEAWQNTVQNILNSSNIQDDERDFLQVLASQSNIPRKKVKFMNFITSGFRQYARNKNLLERVWEILEAEQKRIANENQLKHSLKKETSENGKDESKINIVNEEENIEKKKKKKKKDKIKKEKLTSDDEKINNENQETVKVSKKKSKIVETSESIETKDCSENKKKGKKRKCEEQDETEPKKLKDNNCENEFLWMDTITNILNKKAKNKQISVEKLESKTLKKYVEQTGKEITYKIKRRFRKRLAKVPNISINDTTIIINE